MYNSSNRERSSGRPSNQSGPSRRSTGAGRPSYNKRSNFTKGGDNLTGGSFVRAERPARSSDRGGERSGDSRRSFAPKTGDFRRTPSSTSGDFRRSSAPTTGDYRRSSAPATGDFRRSSAPSSGGYRGGDRGGDSRRSGGYSGGSSSFSGGRSFSRGPARGSSRGGSGGGSFGRRPGGARRFQGKYIAEDKFINKNPTTKEQTNYTPSHTFADFGFDAGLVANLTKKGYVHPTRIQDESIPHLLEGKNVVGLANTGSGKTAAFALPIIHKLKNQKTRQTALIIAPTRELANQIEDEIKIFAQGLGIYTALCVGGMSISFQKRQLYKNPQIIIGTPGRLKDLFNQKCLNLKNVGTLVLDEADRMLDMGFLKDIEHIISQLGDNPQSLCFSATITGDISKIIDKIMPDHVTISVRTSETGEHIAQDIIKVTSGDHKIDMLLKMLGEPHFEKVLIFGEMKHSVQKLADTLSKAGFPSEAIHGNKTQAQRNRSLSAFKTGRVNVLVATDVAARGLDIPNVTHVINFDKPSSYEDYIHRIGRTGRAGKDGQAYTFIQH